MIRVPSLIKISEVPGATAGETEFIVTNEATGRFFRSNQVAVQFLDALRRSGDTKAAAASAGLVPAHADTLLRQFKQFGIATEAGRTDADATPAKGPLEGKLISLRFDLVDAARSAKRYEWLGRILYSTPAYVIWALAILATLVTLFRNGDKVMLSLGQFPDMGIVLWIAFIAIYIATKVIHEMGHALAYRVMCLREGHDPGPIRMGIMVFAGTPFPFTDVTGAWRLKSRWKRAMIGAGGIYFETWVIAILTLIWSQVQVGPVQTILLQVAVISGAMALIFNLNPAVKLDGYYIMTDIFHAPNLAGRASSAARTVAARALGADLSPPKRGELLYWIISYLYRWTIFAGIFWIAYKIDPRLGPPIAIVTVMMLVLRPLLATYQFSKARGANPMRLFALTAIVGAFVILSLVPFRARLLIEGQMLKYETTFVRPPEAVRVQVADDGAAIAMTSPALEQSFRDLTLRQEIYANLNRSIQGSGAEQAALLSDRANLTRMRSEVETRLAALDVSAENNAVWTPLEADVLAGAWTTASAEQPLGAISKPVDPYLQLRLEQNRIEQDMLPLFDAQVRVRLVQDTGCEADATIASDLSASAAIDGSFLLKAKLQSPLPQCLETVRSGAALVARLSIPPQSLFQRLRKRASRLLQDRLPINLTSTQQ
jgi:hypothetical protein